MYELIEANVLLSKLLDTCKRSVGNYVFSQILYTANVTPEQYDELIESSDKIQFSIHISLN